MPIFDDLLAQLTAREPAPLLPKAPFSSEISAQISAASDADLFAGQKYSPDQQNALRSGLLLLNDDLHASHDISQSIKTPTGSAWHAIMHRREGDASNSNYWWRLTGEHPAFDDIYHAASKYLHGAPNEEAQAFAAKMQGAGHWNPGDFVRACESARSDDEWLRGLQQVEMTTLLDWCKRNN